MFMWKIEKRSGQKRAGVMSRTLKGDKKGDDPAHASVSLYPSNSLIKRISMPIDPFFPLARKVALLDLLLEVDAFQADFVDAPSVLQRSRPHGYGNERDVNGFRSRPKFEE